MSLWSDIKDAHREAADIWDDARVEFLEDNDDALSRLGFRGVWFLSWAGGTFLIGVLVALLGVIVTAGSANGIGGDIGFALGSFLFNITWFTVWARSYTFRDENKVDLNK